MKRFRHHEFLRNFILSHLKLSLIFWNSYLNFFKTSIILLFLIFLIFIVLYNLINRSMPKRQKCPTCSKGWCKNHLFEFIPMKKDLYFKKIQKIRVCPKLNKYALNESDHQILTKK